MDKKNPASLSSSNEVLRLIYQGKLPVSLSGSTGFVDVRDVADAHLAAWQKGASGERYIIVGHNLSFRQLFDHIGHIEGSRNAPVFNLPKGIGFLAGLGGELWSLLSSRPSFISLESLRGSSKLFVYNNSRSVQELGLSYRALSDTLKTIVT